MARLAPLHRSAFSPAQMRTRSSRMALVGLLLTTLGVSTSALAQVQPTTQPTAVQGQPRSQPAVPLRPDLVPDAIVPETAGITSLPTYPSRDSGVGHLRPDDLTSLTGPSWPQSPLLQAGWLQSVALPIYPSPGSDHWGWMINGWLIPNGAKPLAIGRDAAFSMMLTEPRIYTFPVLEVRPDGWFRFQYTAAGEAWAHTSHLGLGAISLTIEPWSAYVRDASRVAFRRPGLSQPMRVNPSTTAPLRALVGSNSLIQPLDMDGDWLRVRVIQPVQGCVPLPGASTEEGWVRWRDEARNPLMLVPTDGCQQ